MQDDYARKLEDQKSLFRQLGIKLDALSIHEKDFDAKMRGYDKEEVDRFLDDIIVDYERFYDIITDLLDKYKEIQRRQAYWEEEKKALARRPSFDMENAVDRRLVEDGIRQVERSLEQFKLHLRGER
ncbi:MULTISPECIES: DivIVA domain-containing protein [Paenibacillus]|jgi:DivIVA domain-containing protein|uniref:DivIVA domain-containing protein n=2 Tax=Paenibacillus barengoltzii TaxID=343517 RepID=R9LA93_9BACL|nr:MULTISPECIES: DivIVA domain-containing protein [Paenibacillus]EOS55635.1 DivIVA domain-containing protein [Paenibacillus barengoltzii G22]MDU0329066.1 DivIVA domain-containing protein [Paenibacillus sp. 3LSP]MEC2344899.1 DivIVA domain-containing protein [Paenibacillus barengoltzii]SMF01674.1 DivIVA domain-containing protein [Paenibacillus barengoltzii J12]SMF18619.1 DivIVA domain-containing protein [Paenibacillus barengoltzii]